MKAISILKGTLICITGVLALDFAYRRGQIKGLRDANKILHNCLEKAKCEAENKHD